MEMNLMQATAVAHPNVALIKYWGKQDAGLNMPAVGSLSLTLSGLTTRTSVRFEADRSTDEILINGQPDQRANIRVTRCLDLLRQQAGVSDGAIVESVNNFPTGAGLASSASGYAALVKAAAAALGLDTALDSVQAQLDEIARIGSGSAPRSLHSGIVLLDIAAGGGNAMSCKTVCEPDEWPLAVVVAVTSRAAKDVGSTNGMELSKETSPYYLAWVASHPADLATGLDAVAKHDFEKLADISEHSCLKMHAVAMSSQPPLVYWSGATVDCMQRIQELRRQGVPVFFTIDAGPQLKAVCLPEAAAKVRAALQELPGVLDVLDSALGQGAWVE
jgi:diphosphomevalonate decarboxylase